jgi:phosphatidylglycerophosphate synthase
MLDRFVTPLIKPAVDSLASKLVRRGAKADHVTVVAFVVGVAAAACIALQYFGVAVVLILVSRLCDALDGAVARHTSPTDAGGFLDISLDFLFYASIPLGFAIAQPSTNALPAAVLLACFIGTGSSFLAFAALAAKRDLKSIDYPQKSFYFLGGLTEATETLIFFIVMCFWPERFDSLAYLFSALCCVTIVARIYGGWRTLQ